MAILMIQWLMNGYLKASPLFLPQIILKGQTIFPGNWIFRNRLDGEPAGRRYTVTKILAF